MEYCISYPIRNLGSFSYKQDETNPFLGDAYDASLYNETPTIDKLMNVLYINGNMLQEQDIEYKYKYPIVCEEINMRENNKYEEINRYYNNFIFAFMIGAFTFMFLGLMNIGHRPITFYVVGSLMALSGAIGLIIDKKQWRMDSKNAKE